MENLALVFLGLIALAALVQGAFLVALGVGGLRLLRRVTELHRGLQAEILPSFENMNRIAADLNEMSALTAAQVEKVEDLVAETVARVEDVRVQVATAAARPLDSFRDLGGGREGPAPRAAGVPAAGRAGRAAPGRHASLRRRRAPLHLIAAAAAAAAVTRPRALAVAALCAVAVLATRLPFLASSLDDIDAVNFALAVGDFDPALPPAASAGQRRVRAAGQGLRGRRGGRAVGLARARWPS